MNHPINFEHDGILLALYLFAVVGLIGALLFAVRVNQLARKKE